MGHVNAWKAKHYAVEGALIPALIQIIVANAVVTVSENNFCNNGGCACATSNLLCNGTCIGKDFDDNNCGKICFKSFFFSLLFLAFST